MEKLIASYVAIYAEIERRMKTCILSTCFSRSSFFSFVRLFDDRISEIKVGVVLCHR